MMGLLERIGISKGEPFEPDERTKEILELAVNDAYQYMQWCFVTPEKALTPYWDTGQWQVFNVPPEPLFDKTWKLPDVENTK